MDLVLCRAVLDLTKVYEHSKSSSNKAKEQSKSGSGDAELTALGMGTSSCVPDGARTAKRVWPGEKGDRKCLLKHNNLVQSLHI